MTPNNRLDTVLPWLAGATVFLFATLIAARLCVAVPKPAVDAAGDVPPPPVSTP